MTASDMTGPDTAPPMKAAATTQVHRVYIQATPQQVWDAITQPEWNARYGYPGHSEYDLRPGGAYRGIADANMMAMGLPELLVDGEVLEADPPRRLVQTWRFNWSPEIIAEGYTRLTWETAEEIGGITRLTVTHELEGAPLTAEQVGGSAPMVEGGGGWAMILSGLKTLLETGKDLGIHDA